MKKKIVIAIFIITIISTYIVGIIKILNLKSPPLVKNTFKTSDSLYCIQKTELDAGTLFIYKFNNDTIYILRGSASIIVK